MQNDFQIILIVVLSTVLFLLLAGIILVSVLLYKRSQSQHLIRVNQIQESYEKELAKVESEVREITLQNVADEIHDNVGQTLSLAKLYLSAIRKNYDGTESEKLDITKELVGESIKDLRSLSHSTSSEYISSKPLTELLKLELDRMQKASVFEVVYVENGSKISLEPKHRLILYRMFQECLQNAIKHSEASMIKVDVEYIDSLLILSIEDNGKGYDINAVNTTGNRNNEN